MKRASSPISSSASRSAAASGRCVARGRSCRRERRSGRNGWTGRACAGSAAPSARGRATTGTSTAAGRVGLDAGLQPKLGIGVEIAARAIDGRIGERRAARRASAARAPASRKSAPDRPLRRAACRARARRGFAHRQFLQAVGARHGKEFSTRGDAEHASAVDLALLAQLHQIIEQRPRHLGPQIAPDMKIGLQPAGTGLRFRSAARWLRPADDPVVDIGAKCRVRPARRRSRRASRPPGTARPRPRSRPSRPA